MILLVLVLVLMLTIGATGEVMAHNPGGQSVPAQPPACGHEHPGHNHWLPEFVCD